jgi:hypothetical protein
MATRDVLEWETSISRVVSEPVSIAIAVLQVSRILANLVTGGTATSTAKSQPGEIKIEEASKLFR